MRPIHGFFFAALILSAAVGAQEWTQANTNKGPNVRMNSISAPNAGLAYAAGNLGLILVSDGVAGDTTRIYHSESGTYANLNGISAATASTVFVVGDSGTILKTVNSGNSWNRLSGGTRVRLASIAAPTVEVAFAVGAEGTILKTQNGGLTWTASTGIPMRNYHSVSASDTRNAFVAGDSGTLLRTTDGGVTWESLDLGISKALFSVSAKGGDTAYVVGDTGVYFATMDGGKQWTRYPSYYAKSIASVTTWDGRFAVASSGPYTSLTRDGGKTWTEYRLRPDRILHSLAIAPGQAVFTVGERGFLGASTDSGKTWQSAFPVDGDGLVAIEAAAGRTAYALDATTRLKKSSDGGRTWKDVKGPGTAKPGMQFLTVVDSATLYVGVPINLGAGFDRGQVHKSTDGGATWREVLKVTGGLTAISSAPNGVVYAAGDTGVLKSTDGGATWTHQDIWGGRILLFEAVDDRIAFAYGGKDTMSRTTDGGATWARQSVPPNSFITCLSAVSAEAAYASSSTGNKVLRLNAAGTAWDTLRTGLDKGLLSISVVDAQTVYASGKKGALIKTTDGGKTWTPQIIRTEADLVDIDAVHGENVLVVGTEGVLYWTAGHPSGLGPIAFRSGRAGRPARPVLGDGLLHMPGEFRTWDMRGRTLKNRARQKVILGF